MKTIHKNEIGSVSFCSGCKNYQIQIGNILTTVEQKDFFGIKRMFDNVTCSNPAVREEKRVLIKTPMSNVLFSFSPGEIKQIQSLFGMCSILMEVETHFQN